MTDAKRAIAELSAADPALGAFIERAGTLDPRPRQGDYFTSLARAIVYQQLAGRAAAAIYARLVDAVGGQLTAAAILEAQPEALRAAGLSGSKAAAMLDLASHTANGSVPLTALDQLDDEDVIARLSTIRGIGRWTAEMFLLFELRRPDVWPIDDYAVRTGWSMIHSLPEPMAPRELRKQGESLRPHRSLAALYCWEAVRLSRGQMALPAASQPR